MFVAEAPTVPELIQKLGPDALGRIIETGPSLPAEDEYLHWDKLRHRTPPEGLSQEEWWFRIKMQRLAALRALPLPTPEGAPFAYGGPDIVFRRLHRIDQRCSGEDLNGRQLALLIDAVRQPDATFEGHATSHRVTHETARSDLRRLADRRLLVRRRKGRKHIFGPAPNLAERLKESPA